MSDETEKIETTEEITKPRKKASKKAASAAEKKTPVRKATMPRRARTYTFEQWARRREVKQHHKRGLRAYVPDIERSRSLEEWDDSFKDY